MSFDTAYIDRTIALARDSGALLEIETACEWVEDGGFRFLVRWIPSLLSKDAIRTRLVSQPTPDFNPFLPPDPALLVGPAGSRHKLVLNKFPVIDRHLLLVTNEFERQTDPLTHHDFIVLAEALNCLGGLVFYNGGRVAGASQAHKHLQCIPALTNAASLNGFTAALADITPLIAIQREDLPWRHAFVRHAKDASVSVDRLIEAYSLACRQVGMTTSSDPMPPYNLLVDSDWLLVVPRSRECHEGISINSLGYAGSLFVRHPGQVDLVRRLGPLKLLAKTAC